MLFAGTLAASTIGGWFLWERGRLATDDADAARADLAVANSRAALAEDQLLALSADKLRGVGPAAAAPDLQPLADTVRAALDRQAGDVSVDDRAHHVVVTLDDPGMFRGDDAELTNRGEWIVDHLGTALAGSVDGTLWIHGHVDDAPLPDDAPFESAWELSSARALAVVKRLSADGIDARHLAAVAFGDSRPRGADRAKNRRIEVVIEPAAPAPAARAAATRTRSDHM
jgi:flagellar motor protein MotB